MDIAHIAAVSNNGYPSHSNGTQEQTQASFLEYLTARSRTQPQTSARTSGTAAPARGSCPVAVFRQMTMQSAPGNAKTRWTDEMLAGFAGGIDYEVDTSKTINWDSTADQELTEAQREELSAKYDLGNLTPQDFYDLMSDLTHWNVIGMEDIDGMFLRKMPPPGFYPMGLPGIGPIGLPGSEREHAFASGNLFDALLEELRFLTESADLFRYMMTDSYWKSHPDKAQKSTHVKNYGEYLDYLDGQAARMTRMRSIFASIQA